MNLTEKNKATRFGRALKVFSKFEYDAGVPPTTRELGERLGVSTSAAQTLLTRLGHAGYVEENPHLEKGAARRTRTSAAGWDAECRVPE